MPAHAIALHRADKIAGVSTRRLLLTGRFVWISPSFEVDSAHDIPAPIGQAEIQIRLSLLRGRPGAVHHSHAREANGIDRAQKRRTFGPLERAFAVQRVRQRGAWITDLSTDGNRALGNEAVIHHHHISVEIGKRCLAQPERPDRALVNNVGGEDAGLPGDQNHLRDGELAGRDVRRRW